MDLTWQLWKFSHEEQCCHSKQIENPRLGNKKNKKTQGQISIRFRKISGKNRTFPEKKQTFPEKMFFLSAKIFWYDLFFSEPLWFPNFLPWFLKFWPFFEKNVLLSAKNNNKNVFLGQFKKNQEKPKVLSKTLEKTQGPQKKTKNPILLRKTQDLGRKPKQWQRCWLG